MRVFLARARLQKKLGSIQDLDNSILPYLLGLSTKASPLVDAQDLG